MTERTRHRDGPIDEPKQKTPNGLDISVPTRGGVMRDLTKIARSPNERDDSHERDYSRDQDD